MALILFSAPGAGLGHLVRASALALGLEKRGHDVRVVTHSVFAEGLGRLTGLAVDFIPGRRWAVEVGRYAEGLNPDLVVLDTFPFGIRGEWAGQGASFEFVTVARRIKVKEYLDAAGLEWRADSPTVRRIIQAEPLAEDLTNLFERSRPDLRVISGRIRFPADDFPIPAPAGLEAILDTGRAWLVVHSGPEDELRTLAMRAEEDMKRSGGGEIAAVLPRAVERPPCPCFEYFPAARLYGRAFRIVTAAGYNSMADLAPWPAKHISVPFERRYDDQPGRLSGPAAGDRDGCLEAVELIDAWGRSLR